MKITAVRKAFCPIAALMKTGGKAAASKPDCGNILRTAKKYSAKVAADHSASEAAMGRRPNGATNARKAGG